MYIQVWRKIIYRKDVVSQAEYWEASRFHGTALCDRTVSRHCISRSHRFKTLHFAITQFHDTTLCDHRGSWHCTLRSHSFTALHFVITQFQIHNRIWITYHSLFLFPSCTPPECGAPLRCLHQCSFRLIGSKRVCEGLKGHVDTCKMSTASIKPILPLHVPQQLCTVDSNRPSTMIRMRGHRSCDTAPETFRGFAMSEKSRSKLLTHWGRMTQICVFYITTVQDGWRKSAFLTRACFPCTVHLIVQYIEPVSEWSCWRMFIETWPHSELTFRHRASSI